MLVENTSTYAGYHFDANMSVLKGLDSKGFDGWR